VFSSGRVDSLLALATLPPQVRIFRLEDAGMGHALAEYVLAAVLRVYRRFDRYALSQSQQRWQPEPLPAREQYAVGWPGSA
jgi:glyoxylate/hydroxypyruvate reductase A